MRYYCYFDTAFALFKRVMLDTGYYDAVGEASESELSSPARKQVQDASTLEQTYAAIGSDFYVVVHVTQPEPTPAEGTRLTLVRSEAPPLRVLQHAPAMGPV